MNSYDNYPDEEVNLKEAIDVHDLHDPNKGVEFEVDVGDHTSESERSNKVFSGEDVFKNLLLVDDEIGAMCDKEGLDTFEAMMRTMEDVTEDKDGGVYKKVLKRGAGLLVPDGALVRVHYNAYHELEAEPFDSTRLRQQVEKFRLGISGSVRGLHVAVRSMRKGETSRFIFKPNYFYGHLGCPPRIPPDCTVLFDIEVLSFVERESVDDYQQMTEEEKKQVTFGFVCKVSKSEREEGNQMYNSGMYNKALGKYKQAVRVLDDYNLKNEEEQKEQEKILVRIYLNMALCCSKLKHNGLTITYCHKVLALDQHNVKALYHKGQALHFMSEFDQAREFYLKAQRLDGANKSISDALKRLDQDLKKFAIQTENHKKMCMRMFSGSSSPDEKQVSPADTIKNKDEENCDEPEECSQQFRVTVKQKLEEFSKDGDLLQLPFPERCLTPAEIACILEVSKQLDMKVQRRGTGNASQMVIVKSKKQIQFE